jgi:16S rRNA (adenine1518-N6/adenine1519-N6)-dimethyltransferase
MNLVSAAQTKALLKKYGFRFKKSLGQNFLVDEGVFRKIIQAAELSPQDLVVEIGPGLGTLTEGLAEEAGQVIVVEIDQRLGPILQETLDNRENVRIHLGDVLKTKLDQLVLEMSAGQFGPGGKRYKVVANLPYYITTPIIMQLLEEGHHLETMVFMVQKEVAERMVAEPGGKEFGALSVAVQFYCRAEIVTLVPKEAFIPPPEIESAVIKLSKRSEPAVAVTSAALFFRVVKAAFGQRRKTLLNALVNGSFGLEKAKWTTLLSDLNIDSQRRGETLSLDEFALIANQLSKDTDL